MSWLLDALEYAMDSADKPGRAVRGALMGRADEVAAALPFSDSLGITDPSRRVSGRDLVSTLGGTGSDTADGVLGFGAEVALDPTTYVGLGAARRALGLGGRAAKHAPDTFPLGAAAMDPIDALRPAVADDVAGAIAGGADDAAGAIRPGADWLDLSVGPPQRVYPSADWYGPYIGDFQPALYGSRYTSRAGGPSLFTDVLEETGSYEAARRADAGLWRQTIDAVASQSPSDQAFTRANPGWATALTGRETEARMLGDTGATELIRGMTPEVAEELTSQADDIGRVLGGLGRHRGDPFAGSAAMDGIDMADKANYIVGQADWRSAKEARRYAEMDVRPPQTSLDPAAVGRVVGRERAVGAATDFPAAVTDMMEAMAAGERIHPDDLIHLAGSGNASYLPSDLRGAVRASEGVRESYRQLLEALAGAGTDAAPLTRIVPPRRIWRDQ